MPTPISGNEVFEFASSVNSRILEKTDPEKDAFVSISFSGSTIEFEGVTSSCKANISTNGSVMLNFGISEINRLLSAMNFNAYPADTSLLTRSSKAAESSHPFVMLANPTGSISDRIIKLYETAKKNFREDTGNNPADIVFEQQRKTNADLEQIFLDCMDRSEMNPDWISNLDSQGSTLLNDYLADVLFDKNLNLWDALLQIANKTNLVYTGSFVEGGKFRRINFSGGRSLTSSANSGVRFRLGRTTNQSIGQVISVPPSNDTYSNILTRSKGGVTPIKAGGMWPETPAPKSGKIILVESPMWFVHKRDLSDDSRKEDPGNSEGDMEERADEWRSKNEKPKEKSKNLSEPLNSWCREKYRILKTKKVRIAVNNPIESDSSELAEGVSAGNLNGALDSVKHSVTITENSGSASTVYDIAYVQSS